MELMVAFNGASGYGQRPDNYNLSSTALILGLLLP